MIAAYADSEDGLEHLGLLVSAFAFGLFASIPLVVLASGLLEGRRWAPPLGIVIGAVVTLAGVNLVGGELSHGEGRAATVMAGVAVLGSGLALLLPLVSRRIRAELVDSGDKAPRPDA